MVSKLKSDNSENVLVDKSNVVDITYNYDIPDKTYRFLSIIQIFKL